MGGGASLNARRRSPRGERGLKFPVDFIRALPPLGRSPRGERGLKFIVSSLVCHHQRSLPSRGAWIEIHTEVQTMYTKDVAPLAGSVD